MIYYIYFLNFRLGVPLGSGQFGEVFKGELETTQGKVEVAVKTLKEGAEEEERVKFLQEAAIMGQFKHPNVIIMYGVAKSMEPVRNFEYKGLLVVAIRLLPLQLVSTFNQRK